MVVESPCFLSFLSPSFPKFGMTHGYVCELWHLVASAAFCYTVLKQYALLPMNAESMNKTHTSSRARILAGKEMYQQRGWTWVLAPKPFDVVSSSLYVGVLLTDLFVSCDCNFTWWHVVLITATILALLSIDRLEYWFYGEETPI